MHATPKAGGLTILIVDDDPGIRRLVAEILRSHGYTVLLAGDGVEAMDLALHYPGPIHLLLTDLMMPRLDGWELALWMSTQRPTTATLFMSGNLDPDRQRDPAFLPKPFVSSALLRKINEALHIEIEGA